MMVHNTYPDHGSGLFIGEINTICEKNLLVVYLFDALLILTQWATYPVKFTTCAVVYYLSCTVYYMSCSALPVLYVQCTTCAVVYYLSCSVLPVL